MGGWVTTSADSSRGIVHYASVDHLDEGKFGMEPPENNQERSGMDRRTVLRRGAILGGSLAWTVPAVQTLSGAAFAAGSPLCTVQLDSKVCQKGLDPTHPNKVVCLCQTITYKPTPACCKCVADEQQPPPTGHNLPAPAAIGFCAGTGACQEQSETTPVIC
jgi:hypothetical protein